MRKFLCVCMFSLWFVVISPATYGRETRPPSLVDLVKKSDVILVGTVMSITETSPLAPGVSQYARVSVSEIISGGEIASEINIVTKGYVSEMNPICCKEGGKYLFFAKRGYELMIESKNGLDIRIFEPDKYFSSAYGPFGAYQIEGKNLVNWTFGHNHTYQTPKLAQFNRVIRDICSIIR